eukprot:SAG11_NODE_420_length_9631_cov_12.805558_8_plen_92_part_00
MGKKDLPVKKFKQVFRQIDRSGNGQIEFNELSAWWTKQAEKERVAISAVLEEGKPQEEKLRGMWEVLDIDGSGVLNIDEVRHAQTSCPCCG